MRGEQARTPAYYRLKPSLVLRGWEKLPWALVERPQNHVHFLSGAEFRALELCNGLIDCSGTLVPERLRGLIRAAAGRGIVEPCPYGDALMEDQRYRRYNNRFIRTAHWSVTGKCNYRCKHCYMSAPQAKLGELPHGVVMDIAAQLADCGVLEVSLTGGEPLVRKDWWDIVDALRERHIHITTIYSNGALVNERLLDGLEERGLHPEFNMSYDGDEGWHDWLRGIPGAGEAVLRAFDLCHTRGFPTGAELCLHKGNAHLLRQSVNTLAAHHCGSLKTNPVADTELWAKYGRDMSLTMEEVYGLYLDYVPHFFTDGAPLSLMLGGFFSCGKGKTDWFIPLKKYDGGDGCLRQTVCGHARQTLYLSPEGRMLPCMSLSACDVQYDYPLVTEIGLRRGLTNSRYLRLIDTRVEEFLARTVQCGACAFARVCAGGCRASALSLGGSDLMAPDPAACALFRGGWAKRLEETAARAAARLGGD